MSNRILTGIPGHKAKVYDVLAREREGSDLTLAHCWAHVRRKFVEPRAYLREATLRAARNPGTVTLARELKSSESREKCGG